jgi:DNA-binding CsgD family transcriptional regulator
MLFEGFARQLREDSFACLSFSALLVWMFLLFWSDTLATGAWVTGLNLLQARSLWLGSEAVVLGVTFVLVVTGRLRADHDRSLVATSSAIMFLGTSIFLYSTVIESPVSILIIGVITCGVASAGLLYRSGLHLSQKGPKRLLLNVALALLLASCLDSIILLLPEILRYLLANLMPVLVGLFLLVSLKRLPGERGDTASADRVKGSSASRRAMLIRVVLLPLIVGLSYGLMQRLATETAYPVVADSGLNALAIFISAILIFVLATFFESAGLIKAICFVTIPVIGIAYVLLPLLPTSYMAAQSICIIGFNSFYFMVWALWSGHQKGMVLERRFLLGLFVLVLAESLGSVIGDRTLAFVTHSSQTPTIISLIVVYLLLMAGFFSFDRTFVAGTSIDLDDNIDEVLLRPEPVVGSLESIIKRYGLSAREADVFRLLARGRNRTNISKTLFISDNTTRTHMRNIYRKLGVHSQQVLLDLLDSEQAQERKT